MSLLACNVFINIINFYKILTVLALLKCVYALLYHLFINDTSTLLLS